MPRTDDDSERAALERQLHALRQALSELEHEGRRIADKLLRAGGVDAEATRLRALNDEALRLTRKDIQETRAAMHALTVAPPSAD